MAEMQECIKKLDTAYNHFNHAVTNDEVDLAIYEILAAEKAIALLVQKNK